MDSQKFIPTSSPKNSSSKQKKILISLVVVLLLAGLAVGGWYYMEQNLISNREVPKTEKADVADDAIAQANAKAEAGDYDGAVKILEDYIAKTKSKTNKYRASVELGRIQFEANRYEESLAAYQKAEKTDEERASEDLNFLVGASQSAEATLAIERDEDAVVEATESSVPEEALRYYKLLLELLNSNPQPENKELLDHTKSRIEVLEGIVAEFEEAQASEPSN